MNDAKDFENEEALRDFLLDIECLDELLPWTQRVNLFDILKISRSEIRHSNVLCWLLDPHENHGIGDAFLRGIIQRLVENDSSGRYDIFQVLLQDLYSFSVYREWKNIDILLVSTDEKCVLAIENKVGAHEHSNQLNRYRSILETDYPDYNHILVFLTPDGEEPSDVCNWDILSYIDVVDILERILSRSELPSAVKLMIDNYIDTVRRNIMNDVYDDMVLTATCLITDPSRIPEIAAWLRGSGTVTFANRQGGFYHARVVNQIPFDKILRGNPHRSFAINFRCKPFWYLSDVEPITLTTSGTFITNPGSVASEPLITVYGSGEITLMVGMTITELEIADKITLDTPLMEAYVGTTSMNNCMNGDFPLLLPGKNAVSWSGNVSKVEIQPNWRSL